MTEERRIRVLVADDVEGLRRLLRLVLKTDPRYEVVAEAEDGEQAIAEAQRTKPDVVLLDLSMPVLDGLEALPRIKKAAPKARIVVFSGFIEDRMGPMALTLGADAYLEKGVPPEIILATIKAALEGVWRNPSHQNVSGRT